MSTSHALTLSLALVLSAPAALATADLVDLVPRDTDVLWHLRPDRDSAVAERCIEEAMQSVLDSRPDELVFDAMQVFEMDEGLLAELKSVRNVLGGVAGLVPWRDLMGVESLYAETLSPGFTPSGGMPSYLMAVRPAPDRVDGVASSLSGLFAALAALVPVHVRYDIEEHRAPDGSLTRVHTLMMPQFDDLVLADLAVHDDIVVLGLGHEYFLRSLDLLQGGEGPSLAGSDRFREAFGDLSAQGQSRHFVDVRRMLGGMRDVTDVLAERGFTGGMLAGLLNDGLGLADHVETVASVTRCHGRDVVTDTLTRVDPDRGPLGALHVAGVAGAASPDLLTFVPSDVVAMTMRGRVDLVPVWRHAMDKAANDSSLVSELLWAWSVAEAAMDLSVERDVLSWVGSEHVTFEIPPRDRRGSDGETETVHIARLADPDGARKCLARLENVYAAAAPRIGRALARALGIQEPAPAAGPTPGAVGDTAGPAAASPRGSPSPAADGAPRAGAGSAQQPQSHRTAIQDFLASCDLRIVPATGLSPSLRRLEVQLGPLPVPSVTFGVLGRNFVATTSESALESCLAVAAGEAPGLEEHPLCARLLGDETLSGASLEPRSLRLRQSRQALGMVGGLVDGMLGPMASNDPAIEPVRDLTRDGFQRLDTVMAAFDIVGDELVTTETLEGGRLIHERSQKVLLVPEGAPVEKPVERRVGPGDPVTVAEPGR